MKFNEWLKKKREENGYSVQEFARKAQIHRTNVYELEQNGSNPKLDTLTKTAKAFGMETWRMLKQIEESDV